MRVSIDPRRCQGHAQCAVAAPAVFDTDEAGYGVVLHEGRVPAGEEAPAELAIQTCPEQAISELGDRWDEAPSGSRSRPGDCGPTDEE